MAWRRSSASLSTATPLFDINRGRESFLDIPPSAKPQDDRRAVDAEHFGPLGQRSGLAAKRDDVVVVAVPRLFFCGRPYAVGGAVGTVVVAPLDRVLGGRTNAHVRKEVVEGIA